MMQFSLEDLIDRIGARGQESSPKDARPETGRSPHPPGCSCASATAARAICGRSGRRG